MSKDGYEAMPIDDAVAFFGSCSERFGELAALFDVIAGSIAKHDNLHKLATLGKDVALDYENMAGCWREQLDEGGIKT